MKKMNRLLARQIKQLKLSEEVAPTLDEWQNFLSAVDRTYVQNEEDRYLQERSLSISSREMREALDREKKMSLELAHAAKLTSIGTLASGVAHELNNPLAGVKGYAEIMILENKLNPEDKNRAERILNLVERMSATVSHLLKLTRKPTNKLDFVSLHTAVKDSLELFNSQLGYENIEIEVNIPDKDSIVEGESNGLISVFQNLINNARDEFARAQPGKIKKPKIYIGVDNLLSTENMICLKITDNAGGINKEIINNVFDPFFTTKEVGKGTGLGLSLSRRVVEEFGGKLTASSSNGETNFYVFLKRQNKHLELDEVTSISETSAKTTFPRIPGNKKTVLIVDDEIDMILILEHKLKHIFDITKSTSSTEARDLLHQNNFDFLITDLKMPVISGTELIEIAKKNHPEIGVVLVSGHAAAAEDSLTQVKRHDVVLINKPLPALEILVEMIVSSSKKA